MQRREFVEWIADELEKCLQRNDDKPAWEEQNTSTLWRKCFEEWTELACEVKTGEQPGRVADECVDVIAAVGMLMYRFSENAPKWKRGRAA